MMRKRIVLLAAAVAAIAALTLAGCQPQANEDSPAAVETSNGAVQAAWSPESDCSACHAKEEASFSDMNAAASQHAEGCMTCHSDETGLAGVHEDAAGKDQPKKLKKTEIDDAACLSCHGSYEDLAAKTAGLELLTDDKGTTVNPHEAPGLTPGHEAMTCSDCHALHSDEPADKMAPETCLSCHHDNVYECGTCHE